MKANLEFLQVIYFKEKANYPRIKRKKFNKKFS